MGLLSSPPGNRGQFSSCQNHHIILEEVALNRVAVKAETIKTADGGWTEEGLSSLVEEEWWDKMDVSVFMSQD